MQKLRSARIGVRHFFPVIGSDTAQIMLSKHSIGR
jgi:hypothetical protein